MFVPVTKQTLVENIIHTLLEMIAKGELKPGHALPSERELASMLNVSRTSVREALKALAFNDIVTIKPGSGTYLTDKMLRSSSPFFSDAAQVFTRYRSDYKQIIEARRILEVELTVLAARRIQQEGLDSLEESIVHMKELLDKELYASYTMEDLSFHNTIALNCQNDYLYKAYNQLFPNIVDISRLGETVPGRHWPAYDQHLEIFEAIRAHDEEHARHCMEEHISYCNANMDMFFSSLEENL